MKSLLVRAVLFLASLIAIPGWTIDGHVVELKSFVPLSGTDRPTEVVNATPVMGRYLASVVQEPKDDAEARSWLTHYKGTRKFAAAWLTKEWRLINVGEPIFGIEYEFAPIPTDVPANSALPTLPFPQVMVRDPISQECPYLYGSASQITCLDESLHFERRPDGTKKQWNLPIQSRGYLILDGEVWIKGFWKDHLLARFDLHKEKLVAGAITSKSILFALKKQNFVGEDLNSLQKRKEDETKPKDEDSREAGIEDESENWRALKSATGTFQYDIVVRANSAYVLLRQPLSLITLSWPEQKIISVHELSVNDLPSWAHEYNQLSLLNLGCQQQQVVAWFYLTRPLTYGMITMKDPEMAKSIRERRENNRPHLSPLTAETTLGVEENYVGVALTSNRTTAIYEFPINVAGEWQTGSYLFYMEPGQFWMSAFNTKTKQNGLVRLL